VGGAQDSFLGRAEDIRLLRFPQHLTRLFRLSRSSRTGSCWDPPGSWVCDRSAADTVPSSDRGSVAGSAANRELADSPAAESAVSTRPGLQDSGRETRLLESEPRAGSLNREILRITPVKRRPMKMCPAVTGRVTQLRRHGIVRRPDGSERTGGPRHEISRAFCSVIGSFRGTHWSQLIAARR
jgi:hypothetical protein